MTPRIDDPEAPDADGRKFPERKASGSNKTPRKQGYKGQRHSQLSEAEKSTSFLIEKSKQKFLSQDRTKFSSCHYNKKAQHKWTPNTTQDPAAPGTSNPRAAEYLCPRCESFTPGLRGCLNSPCDFWQCRGWKKTENPETGEIVDSNELCGFVGPWTQYELDDMDPNEFEAWNEGRIEEETAQNQAAYGQHNPPPPPPPGPPGNF